MTLENLINEFQTIPFLFVGSGLSRRYYHLPNWTDLLKQMIKLFNDDPLAYRRYENNASFKNNEYGMNPAIASLIEEDFNKEWFDNEKIRNLDDCYMKKVLDGCSPFKAEMCYYLKYHSILDVSMKNEVTLFGNVAKKSIAGIITTNYDLFFETYLSDFKVYVGQNELLFSKLQGIAEVYKIHGSLNDPSSIVIDERDYRDFKEKSEYLAAKLLTIFIEYPIIFIGYSISDSNIIDILSSVAKCMSVKQVNELKRKFIFVDYKENFEGYAIDEVAFPFENGKLLIMTKITLSDYSLLFLQLVKRK